MLATVDSCTYHGVSMFNKEELEKIIKHNKNNLQTYADLIIKAMNEMTDEEFDAFIEESIKRKTE